MLLSSLYVCAGLRLHRLCLVLCLLACFDLRLTFISHLFVWLICVMMVVVVVVVVVCAVHFVNALLPLGLGPVGCGQSRVSVLSHGPVPVLQCRRNHVRLGCDHFTASEVVDQDSTLDLYVVCDVRSPKIISARPVYFRERQSKMYSPAAYFLARFAGQVPYVFAEGTIYCVVMYFVANLVLTDGGVHFWIFITTYLYVGLQLSSLLCAALCCAVLCCAVLCCAAR